MGSIELGAIEAVLCHRVEEFFGRWPGDVFSKDTNLWLLRVGQVTGYFLANLSRKPKPARRSSFDCPRPCALIWPVRIASGLSAECA